MLTLEKNKKNSNTMYYTKYLNLEKWTHKNITRRKKIESIIKKNKKNKTKKIEVGENDKIAYNL